VTATPSGPIAAYWMYRLLMIQFPIFINAIRNSFL
jgi:hypothetical protein